MTTEFAPNLPLEAVVRYPLPGMAIPGAIAFIDSREVRPGAKVLRIDGRLPGQPGYPLR